MLRSYLLTFILLFGCVAPMCGMENDPSGKKGPSNSDEDGVLFFNGGGIIPTVEAMAMTAVALVPQAMWYKHSFKEALMHSAAGTIITGVIGMGVTMAALCYGLLLGIEPRGYPHSHRCDFSQLWKKPANIAGAILLTCYSLYMSKGMLSEIRHNPLDSF